MNRYTKYTIFINRLYQSIKGQFDYEGRVYDGEDLPYEPINLSDENCKEKYLFLVNKIDNLTLLTVEEINNRRNIIKKYASSINYEHLVEVIEDMDRVEKNVDEYCLDAPILMIANYVCTELPHFKNWGLEITRFVTFDKYETSNIEDKCVFSYNPDEALIQFGNIIRQKISGATYYIEGGNIELTFETITLEDEFEKILKKVANVLNKERKKQRGLDILDLIDSCDYVGLKRIYKIDRIDSKTILETMAKI